MLKRGLLLGAVAAALLPIAVTSAAAPDGQGPWADIVHATNQALRNNGSPVLASRSDPTDALGVAELNNVEGTFYSLGFGGSMDLGFDNVICNRPGADLDLRIVETTREPYPIELVDVYVSTNGVSYTLAASGVNKDALINLPPSMIYAQRVRLVDVTPSALHDGIADGYDVDGVAATDADQGCRVTSGRMTGGGHMPGIAGQRVSHGFTLRCGPTDPNQIEINWLRGNNFHLLNATSVVCLNDPNIPGDFDTVEGTGTGRYNGVDGASIVFRFTDAGEPGSLDRATFTITDASNTVVQQVDAQLNGGNHQVHP